MYRARHRSLIAAAFVLTCAPAAASAKKPQAQTLRVAIEKGASVLNLSGIDLQIKDGVARTIELPKTFNRNQIVVRARKDGISVNQFLLKTDHFVISSPSVYYRLGKRQYRGEMYVWKDGGRLLAVNHIDLEEYLVGLINHEINSEWPMPAVKAQAVVARTYALHQAGRARDARYDLESTVQDQVYKGAQTEDWRSARAVRETAGLVLVTKKGAVIRAYYHSCCGGKTELPENVWGGDGTAIKRTVKDPFCKTAPKFRWEFSLSPEALGAKFPIGGRAQVVRVLQRTTSGRALRVRVETSNGSTVISGNELRRIVGYSQIRSANFKVTAEENKFVFRGTGSGHGVGLCQWGAKGMGDTEKYTYRQILGFYYPGLYIRNLYGKTKKKHAGR